MKKSTLFMSAAFLAAAAIALSSCDKENQSVKPQNNESASMTVRFNPPKTVSYAMLSKASGEHHGQEDSIINNLQLFIFNADEQIESYVNLTSADLGDKKQYSIKVSTGSKTVWAVANSHETDTLAAVKTLDELSAMCIELSKEDIMDFSMFGTEEVNVTKGVDNEVNLDLTRFVARIHIGNVKAQMQGGYASDSLTDVQVYLINAYDEALIGSRKGKESSFSNEDTLVRSDFASYKMANMLYEEPGTITASGRNFNKYFYCYGNPGTEKATKLVIRALLDGEEYFYPIKISDNADSDILTANNSIDIQSVTIKRPGSKSPSVDVSYEDIDFTITVNEWNELEARDIEF